MANVKLLHIDNEPRLPQSKLTMESINPPQSPTSPKPLALPPRFVSFFKGFIELNWNSQGLREEYNTSKSRTDHDYSYYKSDACHTFTPGSHCRCRVWKLESKKWILGFSGMRFVHKSFHLSFKRTFSLGTDGMVGSRRGWETWIVWTIPPSRWFERGGEGFGGEGRVFSEHVVGMWSLWFGVVYGGICEEGWGGWGQGTGFGW